MKKKLSSKVLMSFILSAVLFCMPAGAFLMNSGNVVPAFASDGEVAEETTTEADTEETVTEETPAEETEDGSTENVTEESTEESTETPEESTEAPEEEPECICEDKCTRYEVSHDCEVCHEDYAKCTYVTPNVKITINTPSGWYNDTTKVRIAVADTKASGNFEIQSVQAKIGQNGSWSDITEDMQVEISENSTVYIQVTDQKGNTYEKNRYMKCFDFTKPTLNAAVSDGLLSVQAHDTDSGIQKVYVNGYEFTDLTNGVLNIRLQQFDSGYQNFTIQAMDNAGNMSDVYKTANPYYTDPETEDSSTTENPAEQLPVSAQATAPSSATAQVTEHTKTDSEGNTVSNAATDSNSTSKGSDSDSGNNENEDSETGKEFYTIQTASEKVFYLIIDRDGDEEMVYFLTEISENDLLNTTTDANSETLPKNSAALESAIPTSDGALANNNTDTNADSTADSSPDSSVAEDNTEDSTEMPEETETQEESAEDGSTTFYVILGAAALVLIGGGYYLKVVRKKKEDFLDEDDEEDDGDEEYEEEETDEEAEDDFFTEQEDKE